MYETLALVFVVGMMDHELGHEIAHEGIAPEGTDVGPDNRVDLADERLDKRVHPTRLVKRKKRKKED